MEANKTIELYTNNEGYILSANMIFPKKREGTRRWDIYSRYFNPVTMEMEEVKLLGLNYKVRSIKSVVAATARMAAQAAGMLVWFTTSKDFVSRKAAEMGINIIWRAA